MLPAAFTRATEWLRGYADNPDPLAAAGNLVALVLAGNGPFYPIYVAVLAGAGGMPWLLLTLLSGPVFALIPALARRHSLTGRIALSLTATCNTVFCTWLLGEPSGVELFLLPCAMLASLLFYRRQRPLMLAMAGLPIAAFYFLHGRYGPPPHAYQPDQYAALLSMNAISAGMISIFIGMAFSELFTNPTDAAAET